MVVSERMDALLPLGMSAAPDPDVTLHQFFDPTFMEEHTNFGSFEEFCVAIPAEMDDPTEIGRLPQTRLDRFVRRTTRFDSWELMRNRAAEREILNRLLV